MSRITARRVVGIVCMGLLIPTFGHTTNVFLDLRDALSSRSRGTIDTGNLGDLPKSTVNGDIYERAHALAEFQVAGPALEALDLTHRYIGGFCDDDIKARTVTTVFAATSYGKDLDGLMTSRSIIDDLESFSFDDSCLEVVKCYFKEQLTDAGVDLETYDSYSNTTFKACMDVVQGVYSSMLLETTTQEVMKNNNYGDEIFANGTNDDSPYDLLVEVEAIGNILFAHNNEASEIRFYDMQDFAFYEGDNPDDIEQDEEEDFTDRDRIERLPLSSGVTPAVPDSPTGSYSPPQTPPEGRTQGGHQQDGLGQPGSELPANGPIRNEMCEIPVPDRYEDDNTLEKAEREREYTYERNDALDLNTSSSVDLGSKITPTLEEWFGTDDYFSEDALGYSQQNAAELANELADLEGLSLQAFEDHVKSCIDQHTNENRDSWKKVLWKSITQPTLFTKCVVGGMCKEIGDPSGRGLFRIKICKEPTKGYGVNANQPVKSIEEIIDEMSNVCFGLRESGQLLKHNKTKDHWEHKLMDVKLGDVFSFGLSVTFKPSSAQRDAAAEKRLQIENNKYLEDLLLDMTDDLTFLEQRNKYNTLFNADLDKALREEGLVTDAEFKTQIYAGALSQQEGQKKREQRSQLLHYTQMHGVFIDFANENTELRRFANENTQSMLDTWKHTYKEFQGN